MKKTTTAKKSPAKKLVAKKAGVKKYQDGGKKKANPKSYNESTNYHGGLDKAVVLGPNDYSKVISRDSIGKKPYTMTVTKGGKTNKFSLSEEQAKNQKVIAKKEAGYKKGGTHKAKPKAKKK